MVALTGFTLETALLSLPSTIVSRSTGCHLLAKHYQPASLASFPTQKLPTYAFTFCNSASVSVGMLHVQARASNSGDLTINENEASSINMNGADILAPIGEPSLLSSKAEASSSPSQAETPESAVSASVIRNNLSPAVEESKQQGTSQESKANTSNLQRASSSTKDDLAFLPRKLNQLSERGSGQKSSRIQNAFERAAAYKTRQSSGGSGDIVSREAKKESSIPPKNQGMGFVNEKSQVSVSSVSNRKALSSSGDLYASKESQALSFSAQGNSEMPAPEDDRSSYSNRDNTPKQEGSSLQNFQSGKPDEDLISQDRSKSSQAAALSAFRKAKAYKQQTEEMVSALREGLDDLKETASNGQEENFVEVEIITRDGVIKRRASKPGKTYMNVKEFKKSGMDFVGLDFAEKKKKPGLPAGLSAGVTAPPSKGLPEVEIITRDAGESVNQMDGSDDLYKPKVATWGVFPRPANISKTYGGGRTIKPGEQLETDDEKKAREAKTQQLLADYRRKLGLDVDPVIKANCEKIMKQGNSLMDSGKLREALGCFEDIMQQITFKSELHGLAALQGAVCLDSLNRADEAKLMYEKLTSHPDQAVKKRARQLLFSFQAMEKLKFSGTNDWDASAYRKYFDAFSVGYNSYNSMYKPPKLDIVEDFDFDFGQIWPYAIFLSFPLVLVFILVLAKSS
ncbi:hypothetical protein O6H91_07G085300 [Diphasiastrum complanatum]|uniref:Uncharacterized protein n=3 Tax=Diphasiastrum complanatum TaxID=34168 RepID=A0ACC2D792_DIPCM|nr:hypothetical protein O6H91_07G085300 [Diphasiastrum complanatum]KAJ7550139.1 hypothetical protein O6H91_07G085300 [Diphasiastrum complanatum]KAJ7550140.1 hypothetical protein O6H91_07G085300 [Diphasiastrum complanatum]